MIYKCLQISDNDDILGPLSCHTIPPPYHDAPVSIALSLAVDVPDGLGGLLKLPLLPSPVAELDAQETTRRGRIKSQGMTTREWVICLDKIWIFTSQLSCQLRIPPQTSVLNDKYTRNNIHTV